MKRVIANTENTQCTAFGKRDKRRCRIQRRTGCLTCEIHKKYYDTWYETHFLFDRYYMSKRAIEEVEFQIRNKYVKIPEEWTLNLYTYGEREWYQFLLDHTDISPLSNQDCFEHIVYAELFHKWAWTDTTRMNIYIRHPQCCIFIFRMIIRWSSFMSHGGFYSFLDLMNTYFAQLDWRAILFSTACLSSFEEIIPELQTLFPDHTEIRDLLNPANPITCFVLKFHKKTAGAIRKRCCMYKEELMMAAWAPRRIQRWLDMGYDLDLMDAL